MARLVGTNGSGAVAERIRERRNGTLRPIDRMLLYSPGIADGWNTLLGAIRERLTLSPHVLELVILRIAVLNDAEYEWQSHEKPARAAGLGDAEFDALRAPDAATHPALTPLQHRVIHYTDTMTKDVHVPDSIFDPLRGDFSEPELMELTTTVAAYNMVSRFAVALQVSISDSEAAA